MMGVMDEMLKAGTTSVATLNASAGFLIHPFDVAGVAVLISAGRRVAAVWRPAALRRGGRHRGAHRRPCAASSRQNHPEPPGPAPGKDV